MAQPFIALDWGTSSFRAYAVGRDGGVTNQVTAFQGILAVKDGDFDAALEERIGSWDVSLPILAAGMITSRQGWIERPYIDCPAGVGDLAHSLHLHRSKKGRAIHFATGLHYQSPTLGHDVMRSEETQVFGSLESGAAHFITPGTHSKWIDVENGRITRFATYVTGELFATLKANTILGRLMTGDVPDDAVFARGVAAAMAEPAGLTHMLFSVRSLGLYGEIEGEHLSSYLSGIVIGAEVAHALMSRPQGSDYVVLASPKIGAAYMKALDIADVPSRYGDPLAIVKGLRAIGLAAGVI